MITFVNAKINLGLKIVGRRSDGFHNLETVFYPIGIHNGTPQNPEPLCDILEVTSSAENKDSIHITGLPIDCPPEKNLVVKALSAFNNVLIHKNKSFCPVEIILDKHLPYGAGIGGGSADASFTLKMLNVLNDNPLSNDELIRTAASLGADCPFFILNTPVYATGIGEVLQPVNLDLSGYWLLLIKPDVYISTREAFSKITPVPSSIDLRDIIMKPVEEWETAGLDNDFESSVFPRHPVLGQIKQTILDNGALYAAMSGSGSSLFGIFADNMTAVSAQRNILTHFANIVFSTVIKM